MVPCSRRKSSYVSCSTSCSEASRTSVAPATSVDSTCSPANPLNDQTKTDVRAKFPALSHAFACRHSAQLIGVVHASNATRASREQAGGPLSRPTSSLDWKFKGSPPKV
jgi:hypothetical protein